MKKLMMAAAIACLAVAAQAAPWTVVNADDYNGYKIVLFHDSFTAGENLDDTALAMLNQYFLDDLALAKTKSETWDQHYTALSTLYPAYPVANGTASGNEGNKLAINSAVFMLFDDDEFAPGGSYYLTETLSVGDSGFDFSNVKKLTSGNFRTGNVPEPTSGLLLLLGVAGLALKRKQK